MGYRYRKSINLGGGVRLNLSKRGVGWSIGGKGYRHSHSPGGRRRTTVSMPGTGLSYQKSHTSGSRRNYAASGFALQPPVEARPPSPGLFASKYEREFARGVTLLQGDETEAALAAFEAAAAADEKNKAQADDLLVGLLHAELGQVERAIPALEKVIASEGSLPDKLITKYLSDFTIAVNYAAEMTADLPLDSVTAGVVLAECYRKHGRFDEAIGLLQQLATHRPDPHFFVSLAELYAETDAWDDLDELLMEPDVQQLSGMHLAMIRSIKGDHLLAQGELDEGWSLIQNAWLSWYDEEKNPEVLIGFCSFLLESDRPDDVIRVTTANNVRNSDDYGFKLKLLQARAMEKKGLDDAAVEIYRELLKSKPRDPDKFAMTEAQILREERQRDPELLKEARYLRGRLYLKMGKHGWANRDLSAVYAQDPQYRDVAQLLEA